MPQPHHILFISSWYPHLNNPSHGIFNRQFAEAAAQHHTVSVIHVVSETGLKKNRTEVQDGNPHTIITYYPKTRNFIRRYFRIRKAYQQALQLLIEKKGKPDLVHLNVALPAGIFASDLARQLNVPMILNEGWTGYCKEDGSYHGLIKKAATQHVVRCAALILPVTRYLEDVMMSHGLFGRYHVVPNVVDTHRFTPSASAKQENTLLHVSAMDDRQKNVSGIIRAFGRAAAVNSNLRLVLAGDGPDRPALESMVADMNLAGSVRFTGRLTQQELVELYRQSAAFVMFSRYETFCVSAAEALACGTKVITSPAGGVTSWFQPYMGTIITDESELTNAMIKHEAISFDPKQSFAFVSGHFSPEAVAEELRKVYAEVLH